MNKLAAWMMRLYPKQWRKRYGDELNALIEDTGADARIVGDLLRGGMRMQMKTWPFLKLAAALGVLGLLLGVGIGRLLPNVYQSRATLQIQPTHISESDAPQLLHDALNETIQVAETKLLSRTELASIIRSVGLYPDELPVKPLEDVIEEMRRNIRVDFVTLPGMLGKHAAAFDIRFTYPDRHRAQRTVSALVSAFMTNLTQISGETNAVRGEAVRVIDFPNLPQHPFFPNKPMILFAGFAAGVAIALICRLTTRWDAIRQRFMRSAVAMGIAGLALSGIAIALNVWPNQYRSGGSILLNRARPEDMGPIVAKILTRTNLSSVINTPHVLYADELRHTPLEDVIEGMKTHIYIRTFQWQGGTVVNFQFDYPDRFLARETVSKLMAGFQAEASALSPPLLPAAPAAVVLDVLDEPSLPQSPIKPNRYLIAAAGGVGGVVLAAMISLLRRRWRPDPGFPVTAV